MTKNSLVIIDFGIANTKSILKTIIQLGSEATISNDIKSLYNLFVLIPVLVRKVRFAM